MLTAGIVLAGGTGKRFGSDLPKQFLDLGGKPVIAWSLEKFISVLDEVVLVCHPDWMDEARKMQNLYQKVHITAGGETRQLSVFNGLSFLEGKNPDLVVIHDGARPLFSLSLLNNLLGQAYRTGSAIPALPVSSTLAEVSDSKIVRYADRGNLFGLQTPQVFRFNLIMEAHRKALGAGMKSLTDDSQVLEIMGRCADTVPGEDFNIKITTPFDMNVAQVSINQKNG